MKQLKWWFVVIMTSITVLTLFLLADAILMGLIALIISFFNNTLGLLVFKWGLSILFLFEALLTLFAVIKSYKEGDDKSGT